MYRAAAVAAAVAAACVLGWLIVSVIVDAIVKKLVPAQGREIERSGTVEMGVIVQGHF